MMLDFLLEHAINIAKQIGSKVVVIITNRELQEIERDITIFVAPRSYAMLLEGSLYLERESYSIERDITEKVLTLSQTKDYIPTFLYFKGISDGSAVGVIDIESIKGIIIADLGKSGIQKALFECTERVNPKVLKAVLNVAFSIAHGGREGKQIGTAFVIGDVKEVLKRSRQLILNPYEGHPEKDRYIVDPATWESVREFAQLDGVFVIDKDGLIISAGRYLEVSVKDLKLKSGLGGRHLACAAMTRETEAIAVVVSESGGNIVIYKDGEVLFEISSSIL
jgi:DNA integrity scanning protein DisA with diadenylate cyclase activity